MLKEEVTFGVGLMNGLPNGGWFAGLVEGSTKKLYKADKITKADNQAKNK